MYRAMGTKFIYLCLLASLLNTFYILTVTGAEYTNQFAIHVEPDVDVDQLAFKHGLVNKGQVRIVSPLLSIDELTYVFPFNTDWISQRPLFT